MGFTLILPESEKLLIKMKAIPYISQHCHLNGFYLNLENEH